MNLKRLIPITALAALSVLAAGTAEAASTPAPRASHSACAEHGKPGSVLGNWLVYDWNNKPCPAGYYSAPLSGAVSLPVVPKHVAKDFPFATASTPAKTITTGGGFFANATEVGTVVLQPGTYFVSVNAKATPTSNGAASVFPQFFVYNQAKNANFDGDLFNVGSGALESGANTNIDSYFSGSGVVTVTTATTLHVLAFGYDSDRGAGSYSLDDLTVTAVPLP